MRTPRIIEASRLPVASPSVSFARLRESWLLGLLFCHTTRLHARARPPYSSSGSWNSLPFNGDAPVPRATSTSVCIAKTFILFFSLLSHTRDASEDGKSLASVIASQPRWGPRHAVLRIPLSSKGWRLSHQINIRCLYEASFARAFFLLVWSVRCPSLLTAVHKTEYGRRWKLCGPIFRVFFILQSTNQVETSRAYQSNLLDKLCRRDAFFFLHYGRQKLTGSHNE